MVCGVPTSETCWLATMGECGNGGLRNRHSLMVFLGRILLFQEYFLSWCQGHAAWDRVRRMDLHLAHVKQPGILSVVYEAMDDEPCLAVQLEVGSLDGGWVSGRDHLV